MATRREGYTNYVDPSGERFVDERFFFANVGYGHGCFKCRTVELEGSNGLLRLRKQGITCLGMRTETKLDLCLRIPRDAEYRFRRCVSGLKEEVFASK